MLQISKNSVRPILQFSATECGVACLAMLFNYYNMYVSMEVLRECCGASRDGLKARKLIEVAESFGFKAYAYRAELNDIIALAVPVIAYWRFDHYIVITKVTQYSIFINDPAQGVLKISYADFDKYFTGIIIVIEPTAEMPTNRPAPILVPLLKAWLANRITAVCFLLVCILLVSITSLVGARFTSVLIDQILVGNRTKLLPYLALLAIVQGGVLFIGLRLQKIIQFRLVMKGSVSKSASMMMHMLKLPLLFFSLRQKPEIAATLMRAESIANSIFDSFTNCFGSIVIGVATFIFLAIINSYLAFVLSLQVLFSIFPIIILSKYNEYYEQENVIKVGRYQSLTLSSLRNLETLKICGMEYANLSKWIGALFNKFSGSDKSTYIGLLIDLITRMLYASTTLMTLYFGSLQVADGKLSVGNLIAFCGLQSIFISQATTIIQSFKAIRNVFATASRINDLLNYPIDKRFNQLTDSMRLSAKQNGSILSCKSLFFYYNLSDQPAITDVSLTILPGQHIAFVGRTGSGKSTLVKLLAHLYPPTSGRLLLNGHEYRQGGASELSGNIAYVSQEISLFTGTIYDNLTSWQSDVSLEVIESAINDACLTDLIRTRGLSGKVEECGNNFSGGERQRLEIARALIQLPLVLVLDEATSALDVETEQIILQNLRNRNLTILYVAHRLSTVRPCNCIYFMENGRILEKGTHDDLSNLRSHYFRLLNEE